MTENDVVSRTDVLRELTAPGQPYELETVELYGQNCRAFLNAPATLRDLYAENRSDLPFKPRLAWSRSTRLARSIEGSL